VSYVRVAAMIAILSASATARANTLVCVAQGEGSTANCNNATFNLHLDFTDAAARERYLKELDQRFVDKDDKVQFLKQVNDRADALQKRVLRLQEQQNIQGQLLQALKQRSANDALLSGDINRRIDELTQQIVAADQQRQLERDEVQEQLAALGDLSRSLDALSQKQALTDRRVAELDGSISQLKAELDRLGARGVWRYDVNKQRLIAMFQYAFSPQRGETKETAHAFGLSVGYQMPGHVLVSPDISLERSWGSASASVTDPRGKVLGKVGSFRTRLDALGVRLRLGYELRALAPFVGAGVRWLTGSRYDSDEFRVQDGNSSTSYPLFGGFVIRPLEGLTVRIEGGGTYWPERQPARYVYHTPNAAATLAEAEKTWELVASAGVGYVLSL
jgi:hypothetical protein